VPDGHEGQEEAIVYRYQQLFDIFTLAFEICFAFLAQTNTVVSGEGFCNELFFKFCHLLFQFLFQGKAVQQMRVFKFFPFTFFFLKQILPRFDCNGGDHAM
jgi:hypothetical protein